ncbi:MAG: hypothetical protein HGA80_06895, partial [Candidatus Omnitrophica bacterium]|nr:hypothetical protein [Candidatus Omnitrophota bacterium]
MRKAGFIHNGFGRRFWTILVLLAFLPAQGEGLCPVYAGVSGGWSVPSAAALPASSAVYFPPLLKGVKVDAENPFRLDFIMDRGSAVVSDAQLRTDAERLVKYFMAALAIPEKDIWVNLSPYEKDRIAPAVLATTGMGRDLVVQDYLLKQLLVMLVDPSGPQGKKFWGRLYSEAYSRYGTTEIPLDTFNKIWIVPDRMEVFESPAKAGDHSGQAAAFVTDLHFRVLLRTDEAARNEPVAVPTYATARSVVGTDDSAAAADVGRRVIREVVVPLLEQEINSGERFASLRQIGHALILAAWYKRRMSASLLAAVYVDHERIAGIDIDDPAEVEKIWNYYVDIFEKGSRNYVQKQRYQFIGETLPGKYFTGGLSFDMSLLSLKGTADRAVAAVPIWRMDKVEVALSSIFRRNSRFALDETELVGRAFETCQQIMARNGRSGLRVTAWDLRARIRVAERLQSPTSVLVRRRIYAYMGYASLIGALSA